jgi:hypothetical protein
MSDYQGKTLSVSESAFIELNPKTDKAKKLLLFY